MKRHIVVKHLGKREYLTRCGSRLEAYYGARRDGTIGGGDPCRYCERGRRQGEHGHKGQRWPTTLPARVLRISLHGVWVGHANAGLRVHWTSITPGVFISGEDEVNVRGFVQLRWSLARRFRGTRVLVTLCPEVYAGGS